MNKGLREDIDELRRYLDALAARTDEELTRYEVLRPRMPPGLYWQVRWLAGRIVRWLESAGIKRPDSWPVGLKQVHGSQRARPLLLWAVGTDPQMLRSVCESLADMPGTVAGFAPVLVTDVADFAFFSRLGWLVEYLPNIAGEGQPYAERKAEFVARLYRGVPALPVTAALENTPKAEIRRWLVAASEARFRSPGKNGRPAAHEDDDGNSPPCAGTSKQ